MNISALIGIIATAAWLAAIGFTVLAVVRAGRNHPIRGGWVTVLILFVLAVIVSSLSAGMVFINPEERGVVISAVSAGGYRPNAMEPGLHFVIPFAESVVRYQISRQTYTMSISTTEGQKQGDDSVIARTADGQQINIDASVIYAVDPTKVVQVHIQWQNRYPDELVRAQSRGIIRDVVAQYNVEQVISSKRLEMVQAMTDATRTKLEANGLQLVDFVLRNVTFSEEYAASVEKKQIAEQLAQQAKFTVEQRRQEAEQARQTAQGQADAVVIQAKGDAESRLIQADAEAKALTLIAGAIKDNPNLLTYQYISKLSPNIQAMLLPSNAPFVFPLPQMSPAAGSTTATITPTATPEVQPTAVPTTTP
jgi:regulator of protease activity HflC (stomatin/prohibitin superfamily)